MSLHKFAEQVAQHGRGDDSLLVHMTPDEVQRLQKFAEANGRTLTINPHTGLPEAGFLSDLFKAVAPIALGAFLGPAGMGMSAAMAGVATGGITALATGSLSRGLMAGLGAYGGAGLGGSLMNAGTASIGSAAEGIQGPIGSPESGFGATQAIAAAPKADVLSAGFNAATASPSAMGAFAKQNLGNLAYAASPILAASMVPTTTKFPEAQSTGYIRQMDFNINPDTGKPDPLYGVREMTPIKASEFKDKTFQGQRELFRQQNPNPYELGVGSLNQPPQQPARMAGGGIVALAGGGVPGYAGGALVSDQQIFDYFASGPKSDEQIARDMGTYNVTTADIARATGTQSQQADYDARYAKADTKNDIYDYFANADTQALLKSGNDKAIADTLQANDWKLADVAAATGTTGQLGDYGSRYVNAVSDKATDANEFLARAADVGLTGADLATALQGSGMSAAAQYALTHNLADTGGITDPNNFYGQFGYKTGALPGDQGGLEGLYANINYSASGLQSLIDSGKMTVAQAQDAALAEMQRSGTSLADIKAATGKSFGDLFKPKIDTKTKIDTVKGGTGTDTITGGTGNDVITPPFVSVTPTGFYGNATNPGDITTNKDGTATVHPNIPYRPYGGFSGMGEVRDAYTKGGGSLGYTAPAPKTIAEFNSRFNKMTGDSVAAYDYLMGKGSGKYPVKSGVSQVSVPYAEYVLGKKTTGLKPATTTVKPVVGVPGQPQTYFNEAEYLAANPDVAAELKTGKSVSGQPTKFSSGYEHWLMYGKAAGRPFAGDYQGYLTAAALANAPQQGGEAPSGPTGSTGNTISGFTPAPPDMSIPEASMGIGPAADGNTGSTTGTEGGNVASAKGGLLPRGYAMGGGLGSLGSYSDGGRLLKGPGDGVSDSIPATIGAKQQPARLADGEFVVPARIVSELGNGSTEAGAKKLYAMMDRVQKARGKTTGKNKVAANSRADKYLPA